MQHIGIYLKDESGKNLNFSSVNFAEIMNALYDLSDYNKRYEWIASVDPYGSTVFNYHQIGLLSNQLKLLLHDIKDLHVRTAIGEVIDFLSKTRQHLYVYFEGD